MATKHTFRADGFGKLETKSITPLQAIRLQCRECYGFDPSWYDDVANCLSPECPLYPFRFGKDPGRAPATEKQREASRRNVRKALSLGAQSH